MLDPDEKGAPALLEADSHRTQIRCDARKGKSACFVAGKEEETLGKSSHVAGDILSSGQKVKTDHSATKASARQSVDGYKENESSSAGAPVPDDMNLSVRGCDLRSEDITSLMAVGPQSDSEENSDSDTDSMRSSTSQSMRLIYRLPRPSVMANSPQSVEHLERKREEETSPRKQLSDVDDFDKKVSNQSQDRTEEEVLNALQAFPLSQTPEPKRAKRTTKAEHKSKYPIQDASGSHHGTRSNVCDFSFGLSDSESNSEVHFHLEKKQSEYLIDFQTTTNSVNRHRKSRTMLGASQKNSTSSELCKNSISGKLEQRYGDSVKSFDPLAKETQTEATSIGRDILADRRSGEVNQEENDDAKEKMAVFSGYEISGEKEEKIEPYPLNPVIDTVNLSIEGDSNYLLMGDFRTGDLKTQKYLTEIEGETKQNMESMIKNEEIEKLIDAPLKGVYAFYKCNENCQPGVMKSSIINPGISTGNVSDVLFNKDSCLLSKSDIDLECNQDGKELDINDLVGDVPQEGNCLLSNWDNNCEIFQDGKELDINDLVGDVPQKANCLLSNWDNSCGIFQDGKELGINESLEDIPQKMVENEDLEMSSEDNEKDKSYSSEELDEAREFDRIKLCSIGSARKKELKVNDDKAQGNISEDRDERGEFDKIRLSSIDSEEKKELEEIGSFFEVCLDDQKPKKRELFSKPSIEEASHSLEGVTDTFHAKQECQDFDAGKKLTLSNCHDTAQMELSDDIKDESQTKHKTKTLFEDKRDKKTFYTYFEDENEECDDLEGNPIYEEYDSRATSTSGEYDLHTTSATEDDTDELRVQHAKGSETSPNDEIGNQEALREMVSDDKGLQDTKSVGQEPHSADERQETEKMEESQKETVEESDKKKEELRMEPAAQWMSKSPKLEPDLATALRFMTEVYPSKDEEDMYYDSLNNLHKASPRHSPSPTQGWKDAPEESEVSGPFEVLHPRNEEPTPKPRSKLTRFFQSVKKRLTKKSSGNTSPHE